MSAVRKGSSRVFVAIPLGLLIVFEIASSSFTAGWAQTTPAPGTSTTQTPQQPAPPATPEPPPQVPSPAAPLETSPPADPPASGDASSAQSIIVAARPAAILRGSSSWDDGYTNLTAAFKKIDAEIVKKGLKASGRPLTAFIETDDQSFRYEAMIPLDTEPAGLTDLSSEVSLGHSPAGKAMKFQHRAAYDEIDSTYEAITAFLDEKGLEAKNLFVEEYLNDVKGSDDTSLQIDIYVFLK